MAIIPKVGEFLGVKKFGQAIGTTARILTGEVGRDIERQEQDSLNTQKLVYAYKNEKNPQKKAQLAKIIQSQSASASAFDIDPGLKLTNKEILGSAANVGLNVLLPGAFKGGKAAILAKNAALGTGFGAASGMEKGRSTGGIVGSAIGGALIGTAIGGAGIFAKAAKDFIGAKIPEWMMNRAVKPALQDLRKNVKYGTETLGKELLDEGVKGGPKKLLEIAGNKMNELEGQLQSTLNHPGLKGATITRDKILPYIKDLVEQKTGTPGMAGDVKRIISIVKDVPEKMSLLEANQMKRRIYTELRDVAYKLDAKLSSKAAVLKQIAKGLKTEIENEVGGTIVKDINHKLSIYGRLENSMVDQLAREMRNNGVGLTDAILLAGGGETSILALLRHLGQGTGTYVAQGLSKVKGLGDAGISGGIKEVIKRGAFNLP